MTLDNGISRIAGSATTERTVVDCSALGVGATSSRTRIDAALILTRQAWGTIVVGATLGSTRGWYPKVVGKTTAHRLTVLLPTFSIGAAWRGIARVTVYIN